MNKKIVGLLSAAVLTICFTLQSMEPLKKQAKKTAKKVRKKASQAVTWAQDVVEMISGETPTPLDPEHIREELEQQQQPFAFSELPADIQTTIVNDISLVATAEDYKDALLTVNSLVQVNRQLNHYINMPDNCLRIIKQIARRFKTSDFVICSQLKTEQAKKQFPVQKNLFTLCIRSNTMTENEIGATLILLHKNNADFNFSYAERVTPLHIAAMGNNIALAQNLLDLGADPRLVDETGKTPLMYAKETNNPKIIALMEQALQK